MDAVEELMSAVEAKDVDAVRVALTRPGVDVNSKRRERWSSRLVALARGHGQGPGGRGRGAAGGERDPDQRGGIGLCGKRLSRWRS